MRVRHSGIMYFDADEINSLSKSDRGKRILERTEYQPLQWHKKNNGGPNRYARRNVRSASYGMIKNNHEDRTKKKLF